MSIFMLGSMPYILIRNFWVELCFPNNIVRKLYIRPIENIKLMLFGMLTHLPFIAVLCWPESPVILGGTCGCCGSSSVMELSMEAIFFKPSEFGLLIYVTALFGIYVHIYVISDILRGLH